MGHREAMSDAPPRWLIYRHPDGAQAFGQIIDEDETRYLVEQGKDIVELEKDRRRQREVPPDSLELLHLQDPNEIKRRFADDQIATIVAVLADRRVTRTKDQLVDHLRWLGVELDDKTWKSLQPKLAKHPNIGREGSPVAYRWKEAATIEVSPEELLAQALSPKSSKDKVEAARASLAKLCVDGSLSPTQQALAAAVGVEGAVAPPWNAVMLDGLEERPADLLLERAASERAWAFLAGVALEPGRPARAARAAELLAEAPAEQRDTQIAAQLDQLAAEMPSGADLAPHLDLIERRIPLLQRALGENATQPAIDGLLELALAVPRDSSAEGTDVVRRWAVVTAARLATARAALTSALESAHPSPAQLAPIATVLGTEPFDADGPRLRWLAGLSKWAPIAPHLQDRLDWWLGLDLDALPVVNEDPDVGPVLRAELARQKVLSSAIERTLTSDPSSLARVLALPDSMLSMVDPKLIVDAAERLPQDRAIARMIEALGAMVEADAGRRHAAATEALEEAHRQAISGLQRALEEQAEAAVRAAARRDALAHELDDLRQHQVSSSDAQKRQAQLEALRALADLVQEARTSMSALTAGTLSADEVDQRLLRLAEEVGVEMDAPPNAHIPLNRALYRPIGAEPDEGATVRVVEPAYVTRVGGAVTPLRYGSVVAVDPGG